MSSDSLGDLTGDGGRYIGAMLRDVWQWVRDQMYAGVVAAGYDDLSAAHVGLWRYPGLEELRPSQIADRVGITKQSVNDLLGHLEQHGYILRVPDLVDGRARVIRLTPKGRRLQQTITPRRGQPICGSKRSLGRGASLSFITPLSCCPNS